MEKYSGNVFKYYPPCRIGFFEDLMVRFTQTKDLNDPSECLPDFRYFCDKEVRTRRALDVWNRLCPLCQSPSKRKHFVRKYRREFNWKGEIEKSYNSHLDIIGIFSLSKSPFNSHLWQNYANGGFCIEFNYQSDFFHMRQDDVPGTGELYSVIYSDEPIVFDARKIFFHDHEAYMQLEVFYQKTTEWKFEDEVRIVRLRRLGDQQKSHGRITLFKIPVCAVAAVYFSPTAKESFIEICQMVIRQNLGNIAMYKVVDAKKRHANPIPIYG